MALTTFARIGVAAAALAGLGAMVACSVLVPQGDPQCNQNSDCLARGPKFANAVCDVPNHVCVAAAPVVMTTDAGADAGAPDPWGCLGQDPVPSSASQVDVQIVLYDTLKPSKFGSTVDGGTDLTVIGFTPQPGVSVAACGSLDLACGAPLTATVTDDAGIAALGLPGGFIGFYYMTRESSIPALFYPGTRFYDGQKDLTFATAMTASDSIAALGSAYGYEANQDAGGGPGLMSITQFDCNDRHVPGVSFTTNPPAQGTLYIKNAFPSATAKETAQEGSAVLVNVAAGSVEVDSMLVAKGTALQTANVNVRSGALTLVYLRPRAR